MSRGPRLKRVNHPIDHIMTSKYTLGMLSYYPSFQKEEPDQCTPSVIYWSKDDDTCMDMLSHCFMSVIWGIGNVRHVWITPHTIVWPQTTRRTCSYVTLILIPRPWTMNLTSVTSGIVVRGQWYMYLYATLLFYKCYITLIKQCDCISIHVSYSLDHYSTGGVHGSSSWVWEPG